MTWNRSVFELYHLFETIVEPSAGTSPMQLRYAIRQQVNYLEVKLCHTFGYINNKINHHSNYDIHGFLSLNFPFIGDHQETYGKRRSIVSFVAVLN